MWVKRIFFFSFLGISVFVVLIFLGVSCILLLYLLNFFVYFSVVFLLCFLMFVRMLVMMVVVLLVLECEFRVVFFR